MAYTALAPSKQVRAVLLLLCAELCGGNAGARRPRGRARSSSCTRRRSSSTTCRRWTTRRCGGGGAAIIWQFGEADRDPGRVRAAQPRVSGTLARGYEPALAARDVGDRCRTRSAPNGLIGGQALDLAGHRPADQFRNARADPSRQDRRAVRRGRGMRRGRPPAPPRSRSRRCRPTRRTSASRSRSSTTCSTSTGDPADDRQGRARRRPQDDVRLVQRRRRRAPAGGGAVRHRESRARAVRREGRPAARALGLRRRDGRL